MPQEMEFWEPCTSSQQGWIFFEVFDFAWDNAMTLEHIQSGFRKTGVEAKIVYHMKYVDLDILYLVIT